jgi:hypothetical protein
MESCMPGNIEQVQDLAEKETFGEKVYSQYPIDMSEVYPKILENQHLFLTNPEWWVEQQRLLAAAIENNDVSVAIETLREMSKAVMPNALFTTFLKTLADKG